MFPLALGQMPSVRVSVPLPGDKVRECGPSKPLVYLLQRDVAQLEDRISIELFQILKDDAVKVLHSKCQQI